jgi:hypothetical protein
VVAAVLLVAAATVGGMLVRRSDEARLREPPAVVLLAPIGDLAGAGPVTFTWRAAPGAIRYDFDLLTAVGDSAFVARIRDTSLTVGLGGRFIPGGEYVWSVRALRLDGREAMSALRRFRLRTP